MIGLGTTQLIEILSNDKLGPLQSQYITNEAGERGGYVVERQS